jgi:hypothetical protein
MTWKRGKSGALLAFPLLANGEAGSNRTLKQESQKKIEAVAATDNTGS